MMVTATATYTPRNASGQFVQSTINPAVRTAVEESAAAIAEEARAIVPVDTGELQNSIVYTLEDVGKVVVGTVVAAADHAAYVEFGTGVRGAASPGSGPYPYSPTWPGMPAQPYMRPAMDTVRARIKAFFASSISVALRK